MLLNYLIIIHLLLFLTLSKSFHLSTRNVCNFKSNYRHKVTVLLDTVQEGIGVEGCKLTSPSGINAQPLVIQSLSFFGYFFALSMGGYLVIQLFDILQTINLSLFNLWKQTFGLLGIIFMVAGITHFTVKKEYENIYPFQGAWGFWYLPGSSEFHVIWTGIAELLLGAGLTVGSILNLISSPNSGSDLIAYSSLGLLILTVLVTPANIFMWTHGARLPMSQPPVDVKFHYVRGALQSILLAQFFALSEPALQDLF